MKWVLSLLMVSCVFGFEPIRGGENWVIESEEDGVVVVKAKGCELFEFEEFVLDEGMRLEIVSDDALIAMKLKDSAAVLAGSLVCNTKLDLTVGSAKSLRGSVSAPSIEVTLSSPDSRLGCSFCCEEELEIHADGALVLDASLEVKAKTLKIDTQRGFCVSGDLDVSEIELVSQESIWLNGDVTGNLKAHARRNLSVDGNVKAFDVELKGDVMQIMGVSCIDVSSSGCVHLVADALLLEEDASVVAGGGSVKIEASEVLELEGEVSVTGPYEIVGPIN